MTRRPAITSFAVVLMPEAPVDEDRLAQTSKDQIRVAGEGPPVKPVSKPHRMDKSADNHFRACSPRMHSPHYLATFRP